MPDLDSSRVLVVGGGAIGGTVAGHLLHAGVDTTLLATNPEVLKALQQRGLTLRGHTSLRHVRPGPVAAGYEQLSGRFDVLLLAVPPPQAEHAARALEPFMAAESDLVCFQNGLCEQRVAAIVGASRVVGGVVTWGASMPEPAVFDKTSSGGFTLGRIDGTRDARLLAVGDLLSCIGAVSFTDNLLGARWTKLASNCAVTTLGTLGGCRLGELLKYAFARRLALDIISEALRVASACGVRLERLSGILDLGWLDVSGRASSPGVAMALRHAAVAAFGLRYRRLRSSMLRAIERGRPPAVDFLNGEVVRHGQQQGISTPVNARAQALVWDLAAGRAVPKLDLVRRLYQETRSA